jgi:hypothetical protein
MIALRSAIVAIRPAYTRGMSYKSMIAWWRVPGRAPIPDESRTLLHLRRRHEALQMDALRLRIEAEGGPTDETLTDGLRLLRRSADGADPARLHGLPAIGRNVTGAKTETDPVRALLVKERRRRL